MSRQSYFGQVGFDERQDTIRFGGKVLVSPMGLAENRGRGAQDGGDNPWSAAHTAPSNFRNRHSSHMMMPDGYISYNKFRQEEQRRVNLVVHSEDSQHPRREPVGLRCTVLSTGYMW